MGTMVVKRHKMITTKLVHITVMLIAAFSLHAQTCVVSQDGSTPYVSIQQAINSLPLYSDSLRVIYIKKGTYREKIMIDKGNIMLMGEDSSNTVITASISRDKWRCEHADDWGVATVNISSSDVILKSLSIVNSYGLDNNLMTIDCLYDNGSSNQKLVQRDGHQMAVRTMNGATRIKILQCQIKSYGGDTISPWDTANGMFYLKDCVIEGGVDLYCPRGWAWAENCTFRATSGEAVIWHDGSANENAKSVFKKCFFTGFRGFNLGRFHKDASFWLVSCRFDSTMNNQPIYHAPTGVALKWGMRTFYSNCFRIDGKQFNWFKDNIPENLSINTITPFWVFENRWSPE